MVVVVVVVRPPLPMSERTTHNTGCHVSVVYCSSSITVLLGRQCQSKLFCMVERERERERRTVQGIVAESITWP